LTCYGGEGREADERKECEKGWRPSESGDHLQDISRFLMGQLMLRLWWEDGGVVNNCWSKRLEDI
jgi:hypothetical protein